MDVLINFSLFITSSWYTFINQRCLGTGSWEVRDAEETDVSKRFESLAVGEVALYAG